MAFQSDEVYNRLMSTGAEWKDKQRAADLLEMTKKSVLASITISFMESGVADSRVMAETWALASEQYEAHIQKVCDAQSEALAARIKYWAAVEWVHSMRTEAVTLREEIKLAGIQT